MQKAEEPAVEGGSRMLRKADKQVARLVYLIDELLDVTRIINGKLSIRPEELDFSDLVQEVIEDLGDPFSAAQCQIRAEIEKDVRGVWDRRGLEQVVINLLTNAAKYAPGTEVDVHVRKTNTHAQFVVRDQGIGIAREDQDKVFDRFERAATSSHVSGLGLGLYIVKQIVTMHEGSVSLESTPGRGATFRIELPLA
jgi:signal transduction histidine kinase